MGTFSLLRRRLAPRLLRLVHVVVALALLVPAGAPVRAAGQRPIVLAEGSVFIVNTSGDGDDGSCDSPDFEFEYFGDCTLREAIQAANAEPGLDFIEFDIPGEGPGDWVIYPVSPLPIITDPLVIDGYTQPGARPNTLAVGNDAVLLIELNGGECFGCQGLVIGPAGSGSTIRGLSITGSFNDAINVEGVGGGNVIAGNWLGLRPDGEPDGVFASGVYLNNTAANVVGGTAPADRNVISANRDGVFFAAGAGDNTGNTVLGNYIGTDPAGESALGNSQHGVFMGVFGPYALSGNTIGGATAAARNVISGNGEFNIRVVEGVENVIAGNFIGTNAAGTAAIEVPDGGGGFEGEGFEFQFVAAEFGTGGGVQIIGGGGNILSGSAEARQVISGHDDRAVYFTGGTAGNRLQGNYIGTDVAGLTAIPNSRETVHLDAAVENVIEANLISGNNGVGIRLTQAGAAGNTIIGNWIGVDATGLAALPNASGIALDTGATGNVVGGATAAARNVISGNNGTGYVEGRGVDIANAPDTQVLGNYIGLNAAGTAAIGNRQEGVAVRDGSTGVVIGGGVTRGGSAANVISGNGAAGVWIAYSATTGVLVRSNLIGLNAAGTAALGNAGDGIRILAADDNTITGNRIAHNGGAGVSLVSLNLGEGFDHPLNNRITELPEVAQSNLIYSNGGLGIDLGGDGPTANDAADADSGPNTLQNFPVLTAATPFDFGGEFEGEGYSGTFVAGRLNGAPETLYTFEFFDNPACDPFGFGEGAEFLGSLEAVTDGTGNVDFSGELFSVAAGYVTATATDPAGNTSEFSQCAAVGPNNLTWTTAYNLDPAFAPISGSTAISASFAQFLDQEGQARWYRFSIEPGAVATITLSDLSSVYDFTVYKDIAQAYDELVGGDVTTQTLELLGAEFAPDVYSPDVYSPDVYSPDVYSPDVYSPDVYSPDVYSPDVYSPDVYSPDVYSPDVYSPDPTAYSAAQMRSLVAVSVYNGASRHGIAINTWANTGDYYVRVRGRNGSFSLTDQYTLRVDYQSEICQGVSAPAVGTSLTAAAGGYESLILVDYGRLAGTPAEVTALQARLAALAARAEVQGVVVDVSADARVAAANAIADGARSCPYAKNLVADAVKRVIDRYRAVNPGLRYIVIVGGDDVIPFYRYPDRAGLAPESNYFPPVNPTSASEASLRLNYVLGQDEYGAQVGLSVRDSRLPIPDLAVGRLVETAAEATGMIDAYLTGAVNGVVAADSSLVTGYDFLTKTAEAVEVELEAGTGRPADTLIAPGDAAPTDPASWTADQLRNALFNDGRHDLIFLAGHFSAASALAADYTTRIEASELATAAADFTNAIIFSAGCHSGYNTVDADSTSATIQPDWAQAFARRQATLIAGTGYQYGDTDFIYYSERLYLNFSQELRRGSGPVSVGEALVRAKQAYLATAGPTRGIHEKAYLIATLFGLPMLSVNVPGDRLPGTSGASPITPAPVADGTPGDALGLATADIILAPALVPLTKTVTTPSGAATATYFVGPDGVLINPAEPSLPLDLENVSAATTVLRGVGLRSATYTDLTNRQPLVSAAVFDLTGERPDFASTVFYPIRPWRVSYYDALANPGGVTHLVFTPQQFVSNAAGSPVGALRRWDSAAFRLFYSSFTAPSPNGQNLPALSAPPAIARVDSTVGGGQIRFAVRVTGDPSAGVQTVWVNYTALSGPWFGQWQPLDLTQEPGDSTLWTGVLPLGSTAAENVRFFVQAASGVGLVTLSTDSGRYYTPGVDSNALPQPGPNDPPPAATALVLEPASSGEYGDDVTFAATLTSGGAPLAGRSLAFTLGTLTRRAVTGADGRASVTLKLVQQPGQYTLTASFAGEVSFAESSASAPYTIVKRGTALTLTPPSASIQSGDDTGMRATLVDSAGQPLLQKAVLFVVSGPGGARPRLVETNFNGQAALGAVSLPGGVYAVNVYFGDVVTPPGGGALDLTDALYAASSASGSLTVTVFPATAVLDDFNRRNGPLGSNWSAAEGKGGYVILNRQVDVLPPGGPIYWRAGAPFGVNQEAFVTLTTVDPQGLCHGLLLKVQGGNSPNWRKGVVLVRYDGGSASVRVETFRLNAPGWTHYAGIPVTFANGDRLGARVLATGQVQIYRNGALVGLTTLNAADQAFFGTRGGRIGLWFSSARDAAFDDFGGGSIAP